MHNCTSFFVSANFPLFFFVLICVTCSNGAMQVNCKIYAIPIERLQFKVDQNRTIFFFFIQHLKFNANCRFFSYRQNGIMNRSNILYFYLLLSLDNLDSLDSHFVSWTLCEFRDNYIMPIYRPNTTNVRRTKFRDRKIYEQMVDVNKCASWHFNSSAVCLCHLPNVGRVSCYNRAFKK